MSCPVNIAAAVYSGRDNPITLVLSADGAVLTDLSAVTRVLVVLNDTTSVDSDTASPGAITWDDSLTYRGAATDVLRLVLGGEALPAGTYEAVELVIFDTRYPNGLRVENAIKLVVSA